MSIVKLFEKIICLFFYCKNRYNYYIVWNIAFNQNNGYVFLWFNKLMRLQQNGIDRIYYIQLITGINVYWFVSTSRIKTE